MSAMDALLRRAGVMQASKAMAAFRGVNTALLRLDAPLDHVPAGTLVHMKIEVPDNRSGKLLELVWRADAGKSCEDARAEILEGLVDTFLDVTMPSVEVRSKK